MKLLAAALITISSTVAFLFWAYCIVMACVDGSMEYVFWVALGTGLMFMMGTILRFEGGKS